ncbi:MAG: DEAD/DEAH box helicase family protein [Verrucomicrobiales bacterium]
MNEAETRAEHIDPALRAAGWGVIEGSRIRREYLITLGRLEGQGRRGKPLCADYVLEYRNTKLAVIEAKAWDEPLTLGVAQAKNYAGKLAIRYTYATNGQAIYGVDMQTGVEGEAAHYPTPGELWAATFAEPNAWRDRFAAVPFEDKGGSHPSRYYQDIAVERVLEAIATDRQRVLLTLATGTGKTFIAFQIVWKLYHARWNLSRKPTRRPRILFLTDRNNLADQAYNAFSAFPEDALVRIAPDEIRMRGRVPKNGSIFFTIFQTFMSGPPKDGKPSPYFGAYPADFFDFIVIDECHRGGANDESTWRGILDYFSPAVQLGLTATPKRRDNVDTYAYFGEPVFIYSLKEGINDGFLTPFRVRQISTTLDEYVYTPDDAVIEGQVEAGKRYGETEKGFGREQMAEMQKIIDAEKSDLFDVLAHVAYALPPLSREDRAAKAKVEISTHFNSKQQVFLDFVLSHYVSVGVEELDQEKLTPLLRLKYHDSIADAVADLGKPDEIGKVFASFQKYLYQAEVA